MTASGSKPSSDPRSIEHHIDIEAGVDAVWKALTDATELTRWFPFQARVVPGVGGEIWLSWNPPWEDSSRIEAWEPGRRLALRGFGGSATLIEFTLEARGNTTRLHLVQSGFASSDWDDELFDGTRRGWQQVFQELRHYLERHAGQPRAVAWPRVPASGGAEASWRRMFGPGGFVSSTPVESLRPGDACRLVSGAGDVLEGTVLANEPPLELSITVPSLGDGILVLRTWEVASHVADSGHEAGLWVSSWELPQPRLDELGARWKDLLAGLFAAPG